MSPGYKTFQIKGSPSIRGNSASRDKELESISKIKKIEEQMSKFKTSLMKREQLVSNFMDASSGDTQRSFPRSEADSLRTDKSNIPKAFTQIIQEDTSGLHKKMEDLQKRNEELEAELKYAIKKIQEPRSNREETRPWKHYNASERRGHSQPHADKPGEWESENLGLKAQLQVLHKELEKTNLTKEKNSKE